MYLPKKAKFARSRLKMHRSVPSGFEGYESNDLRFFNFKAEERKNHFRTEPHHEEIKILSYDEFYEELHRKLSSLASNIKEAKYQSLLEEQGKNKAPSALLENWKLVDDISSKVIDFDREVVVLECLIDREQNFYEEREFQASLFKGYKIKIGSFFKVYIYERKNQMMIEIKNGVNLVSAADFPQIDLFEKYKDINLNTMGGDKGNL